MRRWWRGASNGAHARIDALASHCGRGMQTRIDSYVSHSAWNVWDRPLPFREHAPKRNRSAAEQATTSASPRSAAYKRNTTMSACIKINTTRSTHVGGWRSLRARASSSATSAFTSSCSRSARFVAANAVTPAALMSKAVRISATSAEGSTRSASRVVSQLHKRYVLKTASASVIAVPPALCDGHTLQVGWRAGGFQLAAFNPHASGIAQSRTRELCITGTRRYRHRAIARRA